MCVYDSEVSIVFKWDALLLRQFLQLYVPATLFVLVGAWLVGRARIDAELSLIKANEKLVTGVSAGRLQSQLRTSVNHLRAIAAEIPVRQAIENNRSDAKTAMSDTFMTLLSRNPEYDEVRWLDEAGKERVRVNNVFGQAVRVEENALQNKADRYYFKQAMQAGKGEIYLSPLDLNIENGQIEEPYKPMLRVATPVFNKQEQPRGILIINVAAQSLLQSFATEDDVIHPHLMLINQQGFWLKSPNRADEWGFMFNRKETLATRFPQAWTKISNEAQGQFEFADGLWTWQKVNLLGRDSEVVVVQPSYLQVVSHLPATVLASIYSRSWTQVGGFAMSLLMVSGLLVARLIQMQNRHVLANVTTSAALAKAEAFRKQIEAQQRFRQVVEADINGILVADASGNIVLVNPALADMFGYEINKLINQPVEVLLPEALRDQHQKYRSGYVAHPDRRAMGSDRELLGQRSNGEQFPVEVGLSSYENEGQLFVLATVVDITERNLLLATSKRLASIINSTEDAIISKTLDGMITSWNPGAEKLFGYRAEEVLGRSIELLMPEGREQEERELLARIALGETIAHYDTVRRCKDGHLVEISNTICPLRDALGRVIGASKIARDISDIKQAEAQISKLNLALKKRVKELATANKALDSFAYAVSHDLRAPLRAMSGFSQALLEDYSERLDDEARVYLTEIDNASRRMGDLIDGILTLSRTTRGKLRNDKIDLSAKVQRIRDEFTRCEPGRLVAWEIEPNIRAWGDARLIENVLRNLIGNAWKYTTDTKQALIRFYSEEVDNHRWFCISDNGAGFDMSHADKLYQPFQRLHRQDEFPGLGIGLATVQRIIHRHQGQLRAVAESGKGATFCFTLPDAVSVQSEKQV